MSDFTIIRTVQTAAQHLDPQTPKDPKSPHSSAFVLQQLPKIAQSCLYDPERLVTDTDYSVQDRRLSTYVTAFESETIQLGAQAAHQLADWAFIQICDCKFT
jgi:hypothetical protein